MQLESLRDLYKHMAWADATMWTAVLSVSDVAEDESLQDTLVHLHLTQAAIFSVWKEKPLDMRTRADFASADKIRDWARQYHDEVGVFLDTVTASTLDDPLDLPWANTFEGMMGHPPAVVTLGETIYQVVSHSMHHRGQVNRRLRELGVEPPHMDYIVWLWMDRPEQEWWTI